MYILILKYLKDIMYSIFENQKKHSLPSKQIPHSSVVFW